MLPAAVMCPSDVMFAFGKFSGNALHHFAAQRQYISVRSTHNLSARAYITLKEASETGYWLELLYRTGYIDQQRYKKLSDKCASIRVMLIASCRTTKANM